jgi:hypothetical protein
MNINPAAAASIAGTARAAGRGGESDNQATESTRQQSTTEAPAGKSSESAVDAGDQTQDRGGDGRQVLDVFEHAEQEDQQPEEQQDADQQQPRGGASPEGSGENLDLEA